MPYRIFFFRPVLSNLLVCDSFVYAVLLYFLHINNFVKCTEKGYSFFLACALCFPLVTGS
jgi:hypothetical protein